MIVFFSKTPPKKIFFLRLSTCTTRGKVICVCVCVCVWWTLVDWPSAAICLLPRSILVRCISSSVLFAAHLACGSREEKRKKNTKQRGRDFLNFFFFFLTERSRTSDDLCGNPDETQRPRSITRARWIISPPPHFLGLPSRDLSLSLLFLVVVDIRLIITKWGRGGVSRSFPHHRRGNTHR